MAIKSPLDNTNLDFYSSRIGIDEVAGFLRKWTSASTTRILEAPAANRPGFGNDGIGFRGSSALEESEVTTQSADLLLGLIVNRLETNATDAAIIGRYTTQGTGRSWLISVVNTSTLRLALSGNGSAVTNYDFACPDLERVSIVVWKSGTSIQIYVNGSIVTNLTTAPATLHDPSTVKLSMGARRLGDGAIGAFFEGEIDFLSIGQYTATTGERDDLIQCIEEQRQGVRWPVGGDVLGSDIDDTPVPTMAEFTVHEPTGTLATGDLASWRYLHHPVITDFGSEFYNEFSCGYENEDAEGQAIVARKMTTGPTPSFGAFETIFPSQSTVDTGATTAGGRVLFTNPGQMLGSRRFHIAAVVDVSGGGSTYADVALLARERLADGTLGTIFRLTRDSYTPDSGYTEHPYDSLLSPQLYERCVISNRYGGSSTTYDIRHGRWFDDPYTTSNLVAPGGSFVLPPRYEGDKPGIMRLLRRDGTSEDGYCRSTISYDFGRSWTTPVLTGIPDAPSNTWWDIGPNGELIVVGNPHDGVSTITTNYRRWLYMAVANPGNRTIDNVYGLAEDADYEPTYPGAAKSGGPSYVHFIVVGNYVYAMYSVRKEAIKLTRALIPGLDDDNSDLITSLRARTSYILQHMANRR